MTSKIKVDNINKVSDDSNIINKCGTTITLGASGDSIALASGASQTGFGRTGTVDWQTGSIKTTGFTAVNGEGYFVDTTSGGFTANLPASPTAGDIVAFADYTRTFGTGNLTIGRNSEPIGGIAQNAALTVNGQSATFVYVDGTEGWINVQETQTTVTGQSDYIIATGGTITTCGDYKIHKFLNPGTFTLCQAGTPSGSNTFDYLVVGGGGSGSSGALGGGGGGGFRMASCGLSSPCMGGAGPYPITVGAGGAAGSQNQGGDSIFSSITSAGGGGGGNSPPSQSPDLSAGGSGGGIGRDAYLSGRTTANNGNSPPVAPPQGNPGGVYAYTGGTVYGSAGGGGHSCSGGNGSPGNTGGAGGAGSPATPVFGAAPKPYYIANGPANGASVCGQFAGGGGGGTYAVGGPAGAGGVGGGGDGGGGPTSTASNNGTDNTGGGGGGNYGPPCGASGGSGIVLIRYKFQN